MLFTAEEAVKRCIPTSNVCSNLQPGQASQLPQETLKNTVTFTASGSPMVEIRKVFLTCFLCDSNQSAFGTTKLEHNRKFFQLYCHAYSTTAMSISFVSDILLLTVYKEKLFPNYDNF